MADLLLKGKSRIDRPWFSYCRIRKTKERRKRKYEKDKSELYWDLK